MEFERQKEKKSNQIQYSNQEKKLKNLDRKFEVIESLAPPTPPPPYQKKVKMNETVIRSLLFWLVFFLFQIHKFENEIFFFFLRLRKKRQPKGKHE